MDTSRIPEIEEGLAELRPGECLVMEWSFFLVTYSCYLDSGPLKKLYHSDDGQFSMLITGDDKHVYYFRDDDVIWYHKERMDDDAFRMKVAVNML